jgi:aryl-alcohol dehydrogenase-like predicted oxidoreductase
MMPSDFSKVIFGTMSLPRCNYGDLSDLDFWRDQDQPALDLIAAAVEAGSTTLDTAHGYGRGRAEMLVGRALRQLPATARERVRVITKGGPLFADHETRMVGCDLSPRSVQAAVEGSLQRLRLDTIDLFLAHHPDRNTPWIETAATFLKLRDQGKIRQFGVSNFRGPLLEKLADDETFPRFNQVPYSLVDRSIEADGTLGLALKTEMNVLAHSPLGKGILTGKYDLDHRLPAGDYRHQRPHFAPDHYEQHVALARAIRELARQLQCATGQLALGWLLHQPGVTGVVVGAKNGEQARQNAGTARLQIDPETVCQLARLSSW